MKKKTPDDVRTELNRQIIQEVLADRYLRFSIEKLIIVEDLANNHTNVTCGLGITNLKGEETCYEIESSGAGMVDALFNGIVTQLVEDCHSLSNLQLEEFYIEIDEEELRDLRRRGRGTEVNTEVTLIIDNGCRTLISFRSRNRSMVAAAVDVVRRTVEFFVNSERAVLRLRMLVEDANARNRPDLADRYTSQLSSLVYNTSYVTSFL